MNFSMAKENAGQQHSALLDFRSNYCNNSQLKNYSTGKQLFVPKPIKLTCLNQKDALQMPKLYFSNSG